VDSRCKFQFIILIKIKFILFITLQDASKSIRIERFYNIPLCRSDCHSWFDDCKEDYTCVKNWNKEFKWINGKRMIIFFMYKFK
jgi:hypothetical protein